MDGSLTTFLLVMAGGVKRNASWLSSVPRPPLIAGLPPNIHARFVKRRRQLSGPKVSRAELLRHHLRRDVRGIDAVNHAVPPEMIERPVRRRDCAFGGVAASPAITRDGPAHFRAWPAFGHPRADAAHPASA